MTVHSIVRKHTNKVLLVVIGVIANFIALGQEKKVDVNIDADTGGSWYSSPWVWVVGAAVFILLLVAILRGGGSRNTDA